jgi:serine/threonine protein kinase
MRFLHHKGVILGSIRKDSVFFSANGTPEIAPIQLLHIDRTSQVDGLNIFTGIAEWMSPELLLGDCQTHKSDVYAFGITIYEVVGVI